jgi:hypothetical protein
MKKLLTSVAVASAFAAVPFSANAGTVLGSNFNFGSTTYNVNGIATGVDATFTGSANFTQKTQTDSTGSPSATYTGVGIAGGRTNDEIDVGESITGAFTGSVLVSMLRLMVLYDGPEFADYQERASITATLEDNSTLNAILTINFSALPNWTGSGTVSNISPPASNGAAVWQILNPFGNAHIKGLKFEALDGTCGTTSACTNQSDYALERIEFTNVPAEVPEPSTYLMMLAGLGMLGFMMKRRTNG